MASKVYGPYKATVVRIHDGDTISVNVLLTKVGKLKHDLDLGFNVHRTPKGLLLEDQAVRLYGCNAPELSTPEGKVALTTIQTLIKVGDVVTLISHGWDKYGGRIDGSIILPDGRDLVSELVTLGAVKPWNGTGTKPV